MDKAYLQLPATFHANRAALRSRVGAEHCQVDQKAAAAHCFDPARLEA